MVHDEEHGNRNGKSGHAAHEDHRSHTRVAPAFPVRLRIGDRAGEGVLRDISYGGLFIRTRATGNAGDRCDLEIVLAEGARTIRLQGEIVRATPDGLAIRKISTDGLDSNDDLVKLLQFNSSSVSQIEDEIRNFNDLG